MARVYPRDYANLLITDSIDLGDSDPIYFGNARPSSVRWEIADANANVLLFALPAGGAEDVPVAVFGNVSSPTIIGKDLGFFNGITQPLIAIVDADKDSWVGLGFSSDDRAALRVGGPSGSWTSGAFDVIRVTTGPGSTIRPVHILPDPPYESDVYFYDAKTLLTGLHVIISQGDASAYDWYHHSSWLTLRGKYWDGAASQTTDFQVSHQIADTTPTSFARWQIGGLETFQQYSNLTNMFSGSSSPPAPDSLLHLWKATAGAVTAIANTVLTIENSTHAYLQFLTPNTAYAGLYFGDPEANNAGYILYGHSDNTLTIATTGGGSLAISSSGLVGRIAFERQAVVSDATPSNAVFLGVNTAAPRTITLSSDQVALSGKFYIIKDETGNAGSNPITIVGESGETIDGAASVVIASNRGSIGIYSNGTNWFIF